MLTFPDKYPETLQLVAQAVYDYLTGHNVAAHQPAAEAAFAAAEHVRKNIGGQRPYLSKGIYYEADLRAQEIYERFNGRNMEQLAQEYDLTRERIRQIVTERIQADRRSRQGTLVLDGEKDSDERQ